jgi:hypothetical protein
MFCITVLITSGVFGAIYVVRECKKLRPGHRVLLCYSLICGKAVCLQTYCWGNVCNGDSGSDDVRFTEDTGLFCVTVVCVCARARMYIRNVIGQLCSRSSMMYCQVRYEFWVVLCQNTYVS